MLDSLHRQMSYYRMGRNEVQSGKELDGDLVNVLNTFLVRRGGEAAT